MIELMMATYGELGTQTKVRNRTVLKSSDGRNHREIEKKRDSKQTERFKGRRKHENKWCLQWRVLRLLFCHEEYGKRLGHGWNQVI